MPRRPRLNVLTLALAAASGLPAARADAAAGNGFDPGQRTCRHGFTQPVSLLRTAPSRSPGGLLNPNPPVPRATLETPLGWSLAGCVEVGLLAGGNDEDSALFRTYRDLGGRVIANAFELAAVHAGQARFVEARGGGLGRNDADLELRLGRYNDWTLSAFHSATPHVHSASYRSLWNGVGSASLSLRPGLVPGGQLSAEASRQAVVDALAGTPVGTLQVDRDKVGLRFDATLSESWKAHAAYSAERRQGARPFGAVFGGGDGGGNVEIAESIDHVTHELNAGASYVDARNSLNVAASASLFRNRVGTMTFQNPLTVTTHAIDGIGPQAFTHGRYDLAPDNDHYSVKADYARSMPHWFNARLTASAAIGSMRQDDALVAPTPLALDGATIGSIAAQENWNTTAALTRASADARIDTRRVSVGLALNPTRNVTLSARARHDATRNATGYVACNPLTGQFGRLLNDGSGAAVVDVPAYLAARCDPALVRSLGIVPDAGDIAWRSVPHQDTRRVYGLAADWRMGRASSLSADVEREEHDREHRERATTRQDRLKLSWSYRGFERATLRASFEAGDRGGSAYVSDPYGPFVSASLGPLPSSGNVATWLRSVDGLRKFDLADRRWTAVDLQAQLALSETVDTSAGYTARRARYPESAFGRTGREDRDAVNLDLNYQPASGPSLHAYYALQTGSMEQAGIQPAGCTIGEAGVTAANFLALCGAAGGPLFPLDRTWEVRSRDRNEVAGLGGRMALRRVVLDVDYVYSRGRTSIGYSHGPGIVLTPAQQALAGAGWPDLAFRQGVLSASALMPLTRRVSIRLLLQLEHGRVDDWHYAGVAAFPVTAGNAAYLDHGPDRYRASLVGLMLRLQM